MHNYLERADARQLKSWVRTKHRGNLHKRSQAVSGQHKTETMAALVWEARVGNTGPCIRLRRDDEAEI